MSCDRWRDAISASLDGEEPGIDARLVAAHVARCPACRAFSAGAERSLRGQRLSVAADVPDLSRRITKLAAMADRAGSWSVARGLLMIVALEIIVFSLPALVLGDEQNTSTHAARHLGAFTVAYGAGLLVVAVRPARARTMLPVAAVLAGALVITALIDMTNGRIPLVGEAQHLPEVLSVVLVWLLAVPAPGRFSRLAARTPTAAPTIHVVDDRRDVG